MSNEKDTAMADSSNPVSHFCVAINSKKSKKMKESVDSNVGEETDVHHTFRYPMRILMNANIPGTKTTNKSTYNPMPKMKTLLMTMAELNLGLTVTALDRKSTLIIGKDNFPITETAFKKFFSCKWDEANQSTKNKVHHGCLINGNCTLNHLKHAQKPNKLITWLNHKKVYLDADTLGINKTKTIGYLSHIHPHLINRTNTKNKLLKVIEMTHVNFHDARKLDHSIPTENTNMTDADDKPTVHCPPFKIFQTTIGIGPTNARSETDVIGIKCMVGKAALICKFFLQATDKLESNNQGKFIPAGLANVIGKDTMQTIIHDNNQYLKNVTGIPIYGLPSAVLNIIIPICKDNTKTTQICTTVHNYILNAEWCHGFEPTESKGKYFLITSIQQLSEAHEWLDGNLEGLFIKYIPQFGSFTPSEGYAFPKQGDKPKYSGQLGTYADKLQTLYPNTPQTMHQSATKWNKSPLHKTHTTTPQTLVFTPEEYPNLP